MMADDVGGKRQSDAMEALEYPPIRSKRGFHSRRWLCPNSGPVSFEGEGESFLQTLTLTLSKGKKCQQNWEPVLDRCQLLLSGSLNILKHFCW